MKNKKLVISIIAVAVLIGLMAALFLLTRKAPQVGSKTITVTVVHADKSEKTFTYHTDEGYLDKVLLAEGLIEGYDDQYGFVIEKVDGEEALWQNGVFWSVLIDGESATTGISSIVVEDGQSYSLVYETF